MSAAQAGLVLAPERVAEFAALITEIAGRPCDGTPWLAPALLFSDPAVQARLDMPQPGPDEILVHDYQSVSHHAPLPAGAALDHAVERHAKGVTTEFDIRLAVDGKLTAEMKTALRRVPRRDLAALKPTQLSPAQTAGDVGGAQGLRIGQAQVATYVALSGDRNPIHSDAALAADLGLGAPIVPGLLLLALIQPFAPPAPLRTIRARFMAPLGIDAPFSLSLTRRGDTLLRAWLYAEGNRGLAVADMELDPN